MFGRNASVGAVSLHSARPKFEGSAEKSPARSEPGTGTSSGFVNLPVSDHAAFRIRRLEAMVQRLLEERLDDDQVGGTDETIFRGSFRGDWARRMAVRADYAKISGDGATNIDFDRNSVSDAQWAFFRASSGRPTPT